MNETIEVLTERVKKHVEKASDYLTKADNATLAAGKALQELKARITDRTNAEGKEWGHSWRKFLQTKLKIECSYSHAQRLIGFIESKDAEAALAEYRRQDAAKKRDKRGASQTSERGAKRPADADTKAPGPGALKQRPKVDQHTPEPTGSLPERDRAKQDGPKAEAIGEIPDAELRKLLLRGPHYSEMDKQLTLLLEAWDNAHPDAQKLFCERVGLQPIRAPRKAA